MNKPGSPRWRRIALASLVLGIATTLLAGIGTLLREHLQATRVVRHEAASTSKERLTPVAQVAVGQAPATILQGPEGRDASGYSTEHVDRAAVRSLLIHHRYDELTRQFEDLQTRFEADATLEYWPADAADSFDSAEAELLPELDRWVNASPKSFAPYLARGTHLLSVAYATRGEKVFREVPAADVTGMETAAGKALRNFQSALTLRPKLVVARRGEFRSCLLTSDRPCRQRAINEATQVCPTCLQVRASYMHTLVPRWGGSYQAMEDFANAAPFQRNPKLRVLLGCVDAEKSFGLVLEKKYDDALTAINRALTHGEYWEFLEDRARIQDHRSKYPEALSDADRALTLRPGLPRVLEARARIYDSMERWDAAASDLQALLRVEPTSAEARRLVPRAVHGMNFMISQRVAAGQFDEAFPLLDLSEEIAADNPYTIRSRDLILRHEVSPADLAALEAQAIREPHNFRVMQRIDGALAHSREYEKLLKLWNAFLAQNPGEGRAYVERGGVHFRLGHRAEALNDATKGCELGVSSGCRMAKELFK